MDVGGFGQWKGRPTSKGKEGAGKDGAKSGGQSNTQKIQGQCWNCGKTGGHQSKDCWVRPQQQQHQGQSNSSGKGGKSETSTTGGMIDTLNALRWILCAQEIVNPRWIGFNADTGAGGTVWPMNADYACEKILGPAGRNYKTATGENGRWQAAMATRSELSMSVPMKRRLKLREVVHQGAGEPVRPRAMSAFSDGGDEAVAPRVPRVPSKQAEQGEHHATGHAAYRWWCEHCVKGRGRATPHAVVSEGGVNHWRHGWFDTQRIACRDTGFKQRGRGGISGALKNAGDVMLSSLERKQHSHWSRHDAKDAWQAVRRE